MTIFGGKKSRSKSAKGTKRTGTKRKGTKRTGTKRTGTKRTGTKRTGTKKVSPWIKHVKSWSSAHGMKYGDALRSKDCKAEYHNM